MWSGKQSTHCSQSEDRVSRPAAIWAVTEAFHQPKKGDVPLAADMLVVVLSYGDGFCNCIQHLVVLPMVLALPKRCLGAAEDVV